MMGNFQPDYNNILSAAKNIEAPRLPLYEHIICNEIMEVVLGRKFSEFIWGDQKEVNEYFKNYCEFFKTMGYDTVSFEACIGQIMPGSGALGGHKDGVIKTREDFEKYPWDEVEELYFGKFSTLPSREAVCPKQSHHIPPLLPSRIPQPHHRQHQQ